MMSNIIEERSDDNTSDNYFVENKSPNKRSSKSTDEDHSIEREDDVTSQASSDNSKGKDYISPSNNELTRKRMKREREKCRRIELADGLKKVS
jgi:hypothetical protein